MSVKQTWMVWERQIGGRDQQILLALADMCDDTGGSLFPSMEYLAWKTGLSVDTIRRALRSLAAVGALIKLSDPTPRMSARYRLNLDVLPKKPVFVKKRGDIEGWQSARSGVANCQVRGSKLLPDPVSDPIIETNLYDAAGRIIEFLNEKTGKRFELRNRANQITASGKMILDRLKAKYTEAECRQVIVRQFRLWNPDPKMREYLRPATLFKKSNFENYIAKVREGQ